MVKRDKNDVATVTVKMPMEVYMRIKREAERQMRSAHSLLVYALAKFAEKIGSTK